MKILCMGETLLRFSTPKGYRIPQLQFQVHVGGCETNMAVNLAQLGMDCSVLTILPDNAIGDGVISFLRQYGIDTTKIIRNDMRMGTYYLETGSGNRASSVIYDRADSAMTSFTLDDIRLEDVFDGIDVFVVSGITAALNHTLQDAVVTMVQYCREHGIMVVYDSNYRAKLWTVEEAGKAMKRILPYVDVFSEGYRGAQAFLHLTCDAESYEEKLNDVYDQMKQLYPNLKYITSTKREIISTSVNRLTGYLYDGTLHVSDTYQIDDIVDRVGGGDAFFSGILYGILTGMDMDHTVSFGTCASVLKHTVYGDANAFNAREILDFMSNGTSRINR
ncbi:MAG: PfkB family carbohydrate kinase [Bulleidia sp.]